MENPTRGERLLWAIENTDSLAKDDRYIHDAPRLLQGFSDEIKQIFGSDDVALLLVIMRVHFDGKTPLCLGLLLQDRMIVVWSIGFLRSKTHVVELRYSDVTSVSTDGTDDLAVHGKAIWQFSGFDAMAPIMRRIVADALQHRFEYKVADSGFVSELVFTDLGITLNYQD